MFFFTADQHFNHERIINYCHRPFIDIVEMNETLINKWNNKVTPKDSVYVLGDFYFKDLPSYRYYDIRNRLNGKIFLITGDHDDYIGSPSSYQLETKTPYLFLNNQIALFHWCIRNWQRSHFNSWHLYGHSHGKLFPIGKSWDVGVDNNNFEPLSYREIETIMNNRPDNPNHIKKEKS